MMECLSLSVLLLEDNSFFYEMQGGLQLHGILSSSPLYFEFKLMAASRPQTPRCFLVLDYLFSSTRKLQFYVELAILLLHSFYFTISAYLFTISATPIGFPIFSSENSTSIPFSTAADCATTAKVLRSVALSHYALHKNRYVGLFLSWHVQLLRQHVAVSRHNRSSLLKSSLLSVVVLVLCLFTVHFWETATKK